MLALALSDQTLAVAVLPTARLALEFEACENIVSSDRRQVEARRISGYLYPLFFLENLSG